MSILDKDDGMVTMIMKEVRKGWWLRAEFIGGDFFWKNEREEKVGVLIYEAKVVDF